MSSNPFRIVASGREQKAIIGLFLVSPGEFPSVEELEQMYVSKARKIIRKLNKIFEEKAEKDILN